MRINLSPTDGRDALDYVMKRFRRPGTEVVLAPGRYETDGIWAFPQFGYLTQAAGVTVRSDGTGLAEIALSRNPVRVTDGRVRPDRDLGIWTHEPGVCLKGIRFDGNETEFRDADPRKAWFVTKGLRGHGASKLEDVTVARIRGGYAADTGTPRDNEAFGISVVGPDGGSEWVNVRVEDCPARSYVSAFNLGHTGPAVRMSILRGASVEIGEGNWLALGVNQAVRVTGLKVIKGASIGIYNDTDTTDDVEVENSSFEGVNRLISLVIPAVDAAALRTPKGRLAIQGTSATLVPDLDGVSRGVEVWDKAPANMPAARLGPVVIDRSFIAAAGTFYAIAAVGRMVAPIVWNDTVLPQDVKVAGAELSSVFNRCRTADGAPISISN